MIFALMVASLWAVMHFIRQELKFRRLVEGFCGQRYMDLPAEERLQYRAEYDRHLKEVKDANYRAYVEGIRRDPSRPKPYIRGVGQANDLINPAYIEWCVKNGRALPRRDDSYDGFLE